MGVLLPGGGSWLGVFCGGVVGVPLGSLGPGTLAVDGVSAIVAGAMTAGVAAFGSVVVLLVSVAPVVLGV